MWEKLQGLESRYEELARMMADQAMTSDRARLTEMAQEHRELEATVTIYRDYRSAERELTEARSLLDENDPEMRELAAAEVERLEKHLATLKKQLQELLLPRDPRDKRNVIMEIRAGAGGDEAGLFAADLFRMYARFAESKKWKVEILSLSEASAGGYKEVVALVSGHRVYSHLRYEAGVHRVQRVPVTEAQGRIHTSTATVAVLPEVSEPEVEIRPEDLRIDVFRASGPGGQHVNTTDSAVRITHLPTGLVVTCQDERSQHRNRAKAMKILRARLYDLKARQQQEELASRRRAQVGSGERSERIRTYNFPQNRVTDHRIGLTIHRLSHVLEGDLDELLDALAARLQP